MNIQVVVVCVCVSIYNERAKDRGVTEMGLREWERAVFER